VKKLAKGAGRLVLGAGVACFLLAMFCFAIATHLLLLPLTRENKRIATLRVAADIAASLALLVQLRGGPVAGEAVADQPPPDQQG
jgi:hypothetical protein